VSDPVFEIGERVSINPGVFNECENSRGTVIDWKWEDDYDDQSYWIYKVVFDTPITDQYGDVLDHLWFLDQEIERLVRKPVKPSGFAKFVRQADGRSEDANDTDCPF
jgi:hypothetical protein